MVQLYDGQTLALAGLLQDNMVLSEDLPDSHIPILGPLFRSTNYVQDKTEIRSLRSPPIWSNPDRKDQ